MENPTGRKPYDTDLSDAEWAIIEPLIPSCKGAGRPREVNIREVINAIFYLLRTGCAWRHLPHDFPPSGTVYDYFSSWTRNGTLRGYPGSFLSPRMGASARSQGRQPLENGPPSPAGFPPSAAPTPGDARGWGGGRGNGCGGDPGPGADAPGYVLTPLRGFPDRL